MSHWLEEAEREEQRKKERPSRDSAKIQDKIFRAKQNYDANKEIYDGFIEYMFDLCGRANSLPHEKRLPWVHIDFRDKESKYENHLYYATTAERVNKTVMTRSFPYIKRQHYKHVRDIQFSVSRKMGFADIEVRDDYLAKTRISLEEKDSAEIINDGFTRIRVVFEYEMRKLDKKAGLAILDWLTFRADVAALPFGEEHFKYDKHRKRQVGE